MKRPLIYIRLGYSWRRKRGWHFIAILAPFPPEEQVPGELCAALINIEVVFDTRRPFVWWHFYSPRRDDHVTRVGWCERQWRLRRG